MHPLLLIAARKLGYRQTFIQSFFTNSQKTIVPIAIHEFCVLVNFVRLGNQLPHGRRELDCVVILAIRVILLLRRGPVQNQKASHQTQ